MKAIAAMSTNRVIGANGKLPWKNKTDMDFFVSSTKGTSLLMGRKTWEGLKVPTLRGRKIYVLSSQEERTPIKDERGETYFITQYPTLKVFMTEPIWLCGGTSLYQQYLPLCSDLYLSIIQQEFDGDAFMPEFETLFPKQEIVVEEKDVRIVRYYK